MSNVLLGFLIVWAIIVVAFGLYLLLAGINVG